MQGFKCDRCETFVEGIPANRGHHEWLFARKDMNINSMVVKARVILREGSSINADLCDKCFIECLANFLVVYRDSLKSKDT